MIPRLAHRVRAAARDRRGIATIEFGVVITAVIVIILGTYDIGNFLLQQMKLAEVADVAGKFLVSYPTDTAGMTNAINAALPSNWDANSVTVTGPTMSCDCWSAAGGAGGACSTTLPICPIGQNTQRLVTITLQRNYTPLLLTKILTSTSANYVAQVQ